MSLILLSANAVVCATWSHFFHVPGWMVWQALPGALGVAFIPTTMLRFRSAHPALRLAYALLATWLGALNFVFFAAIACWVVAGIGWLIGRQLPRFQIAEILFGLAFLATAYGLVNARRIRVKKITVQLPHLPESWRGRTAALITDLHLGPLNGAKFLRRVIERLRSLQPEAVFISGDMFDGPTHGLDRLVSPWREYTPPLGIYFVTGNHDEFADRSLYLDPVRRVGIHVLHNEMFSIEGLQLVGVHDSEAGDPVTLRSILSAARINRQRASILLAHRPINLAIAEEQGISLQLSGHTHNGQNWPWNLLVARIYKGFGYGLNRLRTMQVYTSSGVGTWGPPMRVATQSEIVLIRFEKEPA
ncbi:MAG TPA: metallophosphoesterase [Verrucomicrobiae bacterium]|nr:metallophosphoesterase [Verrucomicrobiae bacterium]